MATKRKVRVRDPGAAITADDRESRLPYQTKQRSRRTRGARSLEAALAAACVEGADAECFPQERFDGTTWTPVFFRGVSNKKMHPAEEFFRFSSFRYVVDEARKNARVGAVLLSEVLLGSSELVYRLNRYYYDVPGEELPSLHVCSQAAVAVYNAGWLRYLTSDWMSDDGALAVLHLINLSIDPAQADDGESRVTAYGLGKSEEDVDAAVGLAREARVKIGRCARDALCKLRSLCPKLDSAAACMSAAEGSKVQAARDSADHSAEQVAKSLCKLYGLLKGAGKSVRWEVSVPANDFLHELALLADDLKKPSGLPNHQGRILSLGLTLVSMRTGISMRDLARELGGANFFHEVEIMAEGSEHEDDPEASDAYDVHPIELDMVEYAKRCAAARERLRSEFEFDEALDLWLPVLPRGESTSVE